MNDGDFFNELDFLDEQNDKIAQYIYLDTDKRILKYKAKLTSMDIVNAIEKLVMNTSLYDFNILDKKNAKKILPLKFLREVGKFRLEKNLMKTNNYFVPQNTALLIFLKDLYKKCKNGVCNVTRYDFNDLYNIMMDLYDNKKYKDVDIILDLCSALNIELVEEYNLNEESICDTIKNIIDLTSLSAETFQTVSNLSIIVNSLNCNVEQICKLGLDNKFIEATRREKQLQKVK